MNPGIKEMKKLASVGTPIRKRVLPRGKTNVFRPMESVNRKKTKR